ncbi:MAG: hypothetical protein JWQ90_4132, partial [Hydrocarboniphaga sp.]|nr:hypothetical protein [Hydrocarboniphaga sp.]
RLGCSEAETQRWIRAAVLGFRFAPSQPTQGFMVREQVRKEHGATLDA